MILHLPWPNPKLSPNARVHHMARHRVGVAAKGEAHTLAYKAGKPVLPNAGPIRVLWTLCPPDKRVRDVDNIVASLKPTQDGVALAWCVDDSRFQPTYCWADPVRGGRVMIEVVV